ncbi:hypothetical protein AX16_007116 [Volvariella volvacea WC 439]|nr:hypothetical protein AX16_007116 [Volvariella volvacea WC 439]
MIHSPIGVHTRAVPGSPSPSPHSHHSPMASASPRPGFHRTNSSSDFQIERVPKASKRRSAHPAEPTPDQEELLLNQSVANLLTAKSRVFAVSGRIPIDPVELVLFFRTKSGIAHSLDFPIDVSHNTPPALDVLITTCRPHQTQSSEYASSDRESLFFPPSLPLTTSLELSGHPILAAIRNTLFPNLPAGTYHLSTQRDKLEVLSTGTRLNSQPRSLRSDGRSATIIVTLPVKYRGGALIVTDPTGREETFRGTGGKGNDLEWTAFLADCEYEVDTVTKGCRMMISYAVYLKSFGTGNESGIGLADGVMVHSEPLVQPSDAFIDLISPILNMMRGRKIAFYLNGEYGVNPSEVLAGSLIPLVSPPRFVFELSDSCQQLKGGDALLYHALKTFKLNPELNWTAGGYIWPVDRTVEILPEDEISTNPLINSIPGVSPARLPHLTGAASARRPSGTGSGAVPPMRGAFNNTGSPYSDPTNFIMTGATGYPVPQVPPDASTVTASEGSSENDILRARVEDGGAVLLENADITVLNTPAVPVAQAMPVPQLPLSPLTNSLAAMTLTPGMPTVPLQGTMPVLPGHGLPLWGAGGMGIASPEIGVQVPPGMPQPVPAAPAVPLAEPGKERVPFVSNGELEKLVVNCLIVTFVP